MVRPHQKIIGQGDNHQSEFITLAGTLYMSKIFFKWNRNVKKKYTAQSETVARFFSAVSYLRKAFLDIRLRGISYRGLHTACRHNLPIIHRTSIHIVKAMHSIADDHVSVLSVRLLLYTGPSSTSGKEFRVDLNRPFFPLADKF